MSSVGSRSRWSEPSRRSFSCGDRGHAEVGNGGRSNDDRGAGGRCSMTAARISSAEVTGTKAQPAGGVSAVGAETRMTCGAALAGGFGEGVAHFATGAVAEEADRIDGFAGASGGDEDGFAGQVLCLRVAARRRGPPARWLRCRRGGRSRSCRRRDSRCRARRDDAAGLEELRRWRGLRGDSTC